MDSLTLLPRGSERLYRVEAKEQSPHEEGDSREANRLRCVAPESRCARSPRPRRAEVGAAAQTRGRSALRQARRLHAGDGEPRQSPRCFCVHLNLDRQEPGPRVRNSFAGGEDLWALGSSLLEDGLICSLPGIRFCRATTSTRGAILGEAWEVNGLDQRRLILEGPQDTRKSTALKTLAGLTLPTSWRI
jgi:hypothetical protein